MPTLQQALRAGWDDVDKIAEDSDFDPIRAETAFTELVRGAAGDRRVRCSHPSRSWPCSTPMEAIHDEDYRCTPQDGLDAAASINQ